METQEREKQTIKEASEQIKNAIRLLDALRCGEIDQKEYDEKIVRSGRGFIPTK